MPPNITTILPAICAMEHIQQHPPVSIVTRPHPTVVVMRLWDLINGRWNPTKWSLSSCSVITRYQSQAVVMWDLTRMGPTDTGGGDVEPDKDGPNRHRRW